jgi:subtilisin family serine protease
MTKLDPQLENLLERRQKSQLRQAALVPPEDEEDEEPLPQEVKILLMFTGDLSELEGFGFRPEAVAGDVASGRVNLDNLPALSAHDNVVKIEISRPLRKRLDVSVPSIKAKSVHNGATPYKGTGVIVGVIDTGIDFTHECFRLPGNKSRILFLWDQDLPDSVTPAPPAGFTEGREYDQTAIEAALAQPHPFETLKHKETDGHGTHVAGIAAGNGRAEDTCQPEDTYIGVAPEADLIVVNLASYDGDWVESTNLTAAITYIFAKALAAGKAAVINISLGDHVGAHDGTSLLERYIDGALNNTPVGRAIVVAAGNEGNKNRHAMGTITSGGAQTATIEFLVPAGLKYGMVFDLWYAGSDRFDVSISSPDRDPSEVVHPGENKPDIVLDNDNRLKINSQLNDAVNHDNRIRIEIKKGALRHVEKGKWSINLHATTLVGGKFHCWIEDGYFTGHFIGSYVSSDSTISIPGNSINAITVGAYVDRGLFSSGKLTGYSSHGPTRDNRIKPEIVAPGDSIQSARSSVIEGHTRCFLFCCEKYLMMSGTSMAAPHVAGVIALMLQKNPGLTNDQIRTHLIAHPQTTNEMGTLPNYSWGWGIVDAEAVVAAVPATTPLMGPASVPPSEIPKKSPAPPILSPKPGLGTATPFAPISPSLMARVRSDIFQTETGQFYAQLVRKHFQEVRTLVNTNQRVGTVWVRSGGPTIVRRLLQAIHNPDEPIPSTIDGKSVGDSVKRFFSILRQYGSPALRADLDRYEEVILRFEGLSYNQFLAQLH